MDKKITKGFFAFLISLIVSASCGYPANAEEAVKPEQNAEQEIKEETNTSDYKTGVYKVDGAYKYFENGKFTPATGVVTRDSDKKQVYVLKGFFKPVTGIAKRLSDNTLVYVKKGVFTTATGLAKHLTNKKILYVKKGVFTKATGIAKMLSKNKYLYIRNGVFKKFSGLAKRLSDKKWFFVSKGVQTNNVKKFFLSPSQEKAGLKKRYVEAYARAVADTITTPSMTESQKIRVCFDYVITHFNSGRNPRIPHYTGKGWQYIYAYDMFGPGTGSYPAHTGNCISYGAAFAFIAKAAGCKNVYAINNGTHGWTEINGLAYDPEQYHDTDHNKIYAASYNDSMVTGYWASVSGANSKKLRKLIKSF